MPLPILSADDPRLSDYRALKQRDVARSEQSGKFVAEGEHLVRRLLHSGLPIISMLLSERRAAEIAPLAGADVPVYVLPDDQITKLIGFRFHSGVMAIGRRPPARSIDQLLADRKPDDSLAMLVCPDINNAQNLGSIIRIAAAFAVDAVLFGPRCTDPFTRLALRVSM